MLGSKTKIITNSRLVALSEKEPALKHSQRSLNLFQLPNHSYSADYHILQRPLLGEFSTALALNTECF